MRAMTLGEGKRKVYELIDEYSSGGAVSKDEDIEHKMADFFDIAQKQVAAVQRIVRLKEIERAPGQTEYEMPPNFDSLYRVWRNGRVKNGYAWKNGKIILPESDGGRIEIEYFAIPEKIGPETPDDYVFEVRDDGCQAMCLYVAAQQLVADLIIDYGALFQLYQNQLSTLSTTLPGGIGLRNTFYR